MIIILYIDYCNLVPNKMFTKLPEYRYCPITYYGIYRITVYIFRTRVPILHVEYVFIVFKNGLDTIVSIVFETSSYLLCIYDV